MKPLFTPEELEELARIDAELDADPITNEEVAASRDRDRTAKYLALDKQGRRIAEGQRRYYEANKDKIAEYMRNYIAERRRKAKEVAR